MKGITLFSDLFVLFMLIVVIILMCSLVWVFTEIYGVEASLGLVSPRTVTLRIFFNPIKYESALSAFLELKYEGMSMKKILNVVAIQKNTNIWIDGKSIDATQVSKTFLDQMINKPYLLKIREPEIVIASSLSALNWQKVSTKLFLLDGKYVDLEFYVG
jgi:hypothetical protein